MKQTNEKGGGTAVVRIPKELDDWLTDIAHKTGRTKTYYATAALERMLEDMEDGELALQAERESEGMPNISLDELAKKLGLGR
jgi:RHH-type rel operon transcriptional repressor/antitoxin RelB